MAEGIRERVTSTLKLDKFDQIVLAAIGVLLVLLGAVVLRGDQVGVPVEGFTPAEESAPGITAPVSVTFGQAMDQVQAAERLSITPEVPGEKTWEGNTLTFQPGQPFTPGQTYTVRLEAGAQSQGGAETVRTLEWRFTPREPEILYLGPSDVQIQSLWRIGLTGGEPTEIYRSDYGIADFDASPDGSRIALTVANEDGSGDIWVIDRDGGGAERLTDCGPGICSRPSWRPNGQQIAYERRDEALQGGLGPSRVWFYDFETGSSQTVYEDNQVLGFSPTWSPDGSKLAFFDSNTSQIRVLDVESGGTFRIPSDMGEVGSFAADGSYMVYTDIRMVGSQFFTELLRADFDHESGLERVFDNAEEDQWPAVSPDGDRLVFGRRQLDRSTGFASQMMLYDFQTEELRQLTDEPTINHLLFQWGPAGRYVMFTRFDLSATYAQPEIWLYDRQAGEIRFVVEGASVAKWTP
jgi:Tol biopolymer transport system component